MKKKKIIVVNFIFAITFVAMIFMPFCMLDTTEIIDSELENRRMTMWPGWHFNQETNEIYGFYVQDRVSFRESAVQFYMDTIHTVFGEFTEDLHMYGKNGEVFPADEAYVKAYQNLATNEELIDSLVTYLDRTNRYLEKKQISFFFFTGLDKKTVYGEYIPDYIRVDESRESVMEMLSRKLDAVGVDYVIPVKEFRELKKQQKIYNSKYDTAHWNAFGAMAGLKILNQQIRSHQPDVPQLTEEAFEFSYEKKRIEFISLPIEEQVPVYTLKPEYAENLIYDEELSGVMGPVTGVNIRHVVNKEALSNKSILILGDSFLDHNEKYFVYRYKDVYITTRHSYEHMKYYVDTLNPDVVVFEVAERAFVDDLNAYVNLDKVVYD